ncbi:MAG: HAD-IA family hydrolase [Syntrophales bacterium]|nr:HAD-IA family hydrolase [Syntrophales bacterium]
MTEIDLMVFDFDGTLVRTGKDIIGAVNHTLAALDIPVREEDDIRRYIGDGVNKLIERSLGPHHRRLASRALEIFMEYYDEHLLDTTDLYPGVIDTLNHFRHKKKIIVTNKKESFTLKIACGLAIDHYFEDISGRDSADFAKPDNRLLLPFLDKFGAGKNRTIVVGDGVNDVMLAKNSGVLSCAFLNGLTDREELLRLDPDYCCEDMGELPALFR